MVGTSQVQVMVDFYEKVFGKKPDMAEGGWYGWMLDGVSFGLGEHSEVKGTAKEPFRVIFNLETKEVKSEFERLVGIGAKAIKEPYEMGGGLISTLADPDGNYFQLMTPWE